MYRALTILLVAGYLAIATLPLAWRALGLREQPIAGSLPPTPRPALTAAGVLDESFQRDFTLWFERSRGLLGHAVHVDNGVLYRHFGETRVGSRVRLGRGRVLFIDEDIDYLDRLEHGIPSAAELDRLASAIADAQRALLARGRALVPIIIPAKTSFYRDAVDPRWLRDFAGPPPSDLRLYRYLVDALAARGVTFVDMRARLAASTLARADLWGPEARHWSYYAACLANQDLLARAAELRGREAAPYPCPLARVPARRDHDDYDLWRLLNLWKLPRVSLTVPVAAHVPPAPPPAAPPRLLYVGTSFNWALIKDAVASGRLGPIHMHYYDSQLIAWPETTSVKAAAGSAEWRALVADKDVIVLDLMEAALYSGHVYVDHFLDEALRAAPSLAPVR